MSFNIVVHRGRSLAGSGRQTWGLKDEMDGDQLRGDRHLYFLHPTKAQLMLENQWPGMWGMPRGRSEEGGQGQLSALIALSGSKQGMLWAVMYRSWKGWTAERSRPATVLRTAPSAFSDSHTV